MASRVMRDAIALQLARRGFDGLRQSALWLVTELTADFLRALGTQLQREPPVAPHASPVAIVRRIQRQANMLTSAEWHHAQSSFARMSEPVGPGTSTGRGLERGTQQNAPASVAPLYVAMRGAWNYKQTTTGRQAHSTAGSSDVASISSTPLQVGITGRELSESPRLSKKQRHLTEAWLQASPANATVATPTLLPGPLVTNSEGAVVGSGTATGGGVATGGGATAGRSRSRKSR